jgi:NTE family protein
MKKVSLVLSSGGARGMAHIGVIDGLIEKGFTISSIAGSSIGSVIGGIYAQGRLQDYKEWICELDKLAVLKLIDFTISQQGIIKGDRVFQEMSQFIEDKPIEELDIPFAAVATDLLNHQEKVFTSGSLFEALRASIAIPTILTPHTVDGIQLVDGGVFNPLPVDHVRRSEGDILVVADLNSPAKKPQRKKKTEIKAGENNNYLRQMLEKVQSIFRSGEEDHEEKLSYFNFINKSIDVMQVRIASLLMEQYKPDIHIMIPRNACGSFEYHRAEEMIALGHQEFLKSLEAYLNKK